VIEIVKINFDKLVKRASRNKHSIVFIIKRVNKYLLKNKTLDK